MIDIIEQHRKMMLGEHEWDDGIPWGYAMAHRQLADIFKQLPSTKPERLTDDDFETIRIHLSAYKERLANQRRWKEAEEYQKIIDRFMSFASTQPEIIRCEDCRYANECHKSVQYTRNEQNMVTIGYSPIEWCSRGEPKTYE